MQQLRSRTCRCGRNFDVYADHLVTCPFMQGNERTVTHAGVVTFCDALNHAAHIPSLIEPRGLL
jgi:hypothetical protein